MIVADIRMERLLAQLHAIPDVQNRYLSPWLKRQSRLLASSGGKVKGLVQATPPYKLDESGDGAAKAKARGMAAVRRDIRQVYGTAGDLYARMEQRDKGAAKAFWKLIKANDIIAANDLAQRITGHRLREFDDGAEHKRRRGRDGRVKGSDQTLFSVRHQYIERYIKRRQLNVGLLASAIVVPASSELGAPSAVPAWVARHSLPGGDVRLLQDTDGQAYRMSLRTSYGDIQLQRLFDSVLSYRAAAFQRELPRLMQHALDAQRLASP